MDNKFQSVIRHILTTAGAILVVAGANKALPIVTYLSDNLNTIFTLCTGFIGIVGGFNLRKK